MDHLTIDTFLPEEKRHKTIMKIVSDGTPVEAAKNPDTDTTFALFSALAGADNPRTLELADKYRAENIGFGYGHAKQALFELILEHFGPARAQREALMSDPGYVEGVLKDGAAAANAAIDNVIRAARAAVGL